MSLSCYLQSRILQRGDRSDLGNRLSPGLRRRRAGRSDLARRFGRHRGNRRAPRMSMPCMIIARSPGSIGQAAPGVPWPSHGI